MRLPGVLQRLLPRRWQRVGQGDPVSIVLLLREPHFFVSEELALAAQRAWRVSFAGDDDKAMHLVRQTDGVTLLKAGPHLLSILHCSRRYLEEIGENVEWLPQASQRKAWLAHSAWVAVDYMNQETDVDLAYCVLSRLVAELLDDNCAGVYIPREGSLAPNERSLYSELVKVADSRDALVKGLANPRN